MDISEDAIRKEAYQIYLASGRIPGREVENWVLAEQNLRERQADEHEHPIDDYEIHFAMSPNACPTDTPNPFPRHSDELTKSPTQS
jgi:hypothetical protein